MNTVINGQKTVTTAGTAEQVISTNEHGVITIKALAANTGNIYIGNSDVSSVNGDVLVAEESRSYLLDGLNKIYIDSDVNGEGVSYSGTVERN